MILTSKDREKSWKRYERVVEIINGKSIEDTTSLKSYLKQIKI